MSASKILEASMKESLPYIFSQKKVESFHYEGNQAPIKTSYKLKHWLTQWWEHPSYGLLYHSTDGSIGLRFNDGSTLKGHPFPHKLTFIDTLANKVFLTASKLRRIENKGQLLGKVKIFSQLLEKAGGGKSEECLEEGVTVKMHLHCLEVFLIWLSNGILQCKFEDKSELILGNQHCVYINPNKIKIIFDSNLLQEQNE
jgi:hypothetical protein